MSSLPTSTGIVVIGAGAIGAAVGYALARDGQDVVILERDAIGMGATSGTACMVTVSHAERIATPSVLLEGLRYLPNPSSPLSLRPRPRLLPWLARFTAASLRAREGREGTELLRRLSAESTALHRSWAAELDTGLVEAGTLNVFLSDEGLAERDEAVVEHRAAGMQVELLDAGELRDRQPAVLEARGAAFYPQDAHIDSLAFTQGLIAHATRLGATVLERAEVLRVRRGGAQLALETTAGTIACEQIVLAGGVWSGRLAADLGLSIPLTGAKGYHVEYEELEQQIAQPVFLWETRVVATPLAGRLRLAGTLELGSDPEAVGSRRVDAVIAAGTRHIAGVAGARVSHVWRGLRPFSPDGMPIVGRAPHDERVLVATGHAMLGITLAPVTAEQIATLAAGGELAPELAPLRPERFRRLPLVG